MSWINVIGLKLQGEWENEDGLTVYHMSQEEMDRRAEGTLAVIGTTTYVSGPKGSYKQHDYTIVDMTQAVSIDIFYDIEDDYSMDQTITFANGEKVYGCSRNHEEVERWEKLGIPITKSYGY